jgi:hypothetical protein
MENYMKMIQYQHRCEGGGNDVTVDCSAGFNHGELVLVVSESEIHDLLKRAQKLIGDMMPGVRFIALPSYAELNDVQVELGQTIAQIEKL